MEWPQPGLEWRLLDTQSNALTITRPINLLLYLPKGSIKDCYYIIINSKDNHIYLNSIQYVMYLFCSECQESLSRVGWSYIACWVVSHQVLLSHPLYCFPVNLSSHYWGKAVDWLFVTAAHSSTPFHCSPCCLHSRAVLVGFGLTLSLRTFCCCSFSLLGWFGVALSLRVPPCWLAKWQVMV